MTYPLPSDPSPRLRRRSGMTLIEMMVALGASTLLLAAVATAWAFTARSFVAIGNYADMDNASRNALDVMSQEIRGATSLVLPYKTNKITLRNPDNSTFTYVFDPNAATLVRSNSAGNRILLRECEYVTFNISQRNVTNNFLFVSTADQPALTKLVDVTWKCSRKILGAKVNTESVQTAKIVLRN
jgi:prepilin-type N-terminal cleavage/methylation domain-containing protein